MRNKYSTISSKTIYTNPYWEYRLDKYVMPNGEEGEYHYVYSRGSTIAIPMLDDGRFVMVEQYRYLNERYSLEFPGGGIIEGVAPEDNVQNEMKEEIGRFAGDLELIGKYNPFNGVTNEESWVFLARDLEIGESQPDKSEEFVIKRLNANDIDEKIGSGEMWDGMSIAAWSLVKHSKKWRFLL